MKIYLLVCSDPVTQNVTAVLKQTILGYKDYLSASIQKKILEDDLEKFQEWQEGIEDLCQKLNDEDIANFIDCQEVSLNWKYHNSQWRFYYGSKLFEPFIPKYFSYEIEDIEVEGI